MPNDRIARMRPLVVVSIRSASSSSCVRSPYCCDQLANRVAPVEAARVDLDPELRELLEVRAALLDLFFFETSPLIH